MMIDLTSQCKTNLVQIGLKYFYKLVEEKQISEVYNHSLFIEEKLGRLQKVFISCFCTKQFSFDSKAKTKGMGTRVDIGVKYADKQERSFDEEKLKAGNCVIGLQVWRIGITYSRIGWCCILVP